MIRAVSIVRPQSLASPTATPPRPRAASRPVTDTFEPAAQRPGFTSPPPIAEYAAGRQLGAPTAAAQPFEGGMAQTFSGGADSQNRPCLVATGPDGAAHLVRNDFFAQYVGQSQHGALGRPVDDEHWDGNQVVQHFEHGTLNWTAARGAWVEANAPTMPVVPTPPCNAVQAYRPMFNPFQVTSSVTVGSHLGADFGPLTYYSDANRVNTVADALQKAGVSYATVNVDIDHPHANDLAIQALKNHGIEPLVRLIDGSHDDKPLNQYSSDEIARAGAAAGVLAQEGVKMVVIDNEPNLKAIPHDGPGFDQAMRDYAQNASQLMKAIRQNAPGMAIGLPPMAPAKQPGHSPADVAWEEKLYKGILGGLKQVNDSSSDPALRGHVFDNTFLATHTYRAGYGGARLNEDYRAMAREVLGPVGAGLNTLATEGGHFPSRDANGDLDEHGSFRVNNGDFRYLGDSAHPWDTWDRTEDTTCLWIAADQYLDPNGGGGGWEDGTLIHADGREAETLQKLQQIYAGTYSPQPGDYV